MVRRILLLCCAANAVAASAALPGANAAPPPGIVVVAADEITASDAWARATPGGATTGAAYVTLTGGRQADALVGVSTPAAATADVHESISDNGVMRMRRVAAVPIPAGGTVKLAPGGYHIMLMGLRQPLTAGQAFPLTLQFQHAAPVTLQVQVRGLGGTSEHDTHMMGGMKM